MPGSRFDPALLKVRSDFLSELPAACDALEAKVLMLEQHATSDSGSLFRDLHSLKGAAGAVGLGLVASICHDFETFIESVQESAAGVPFSHQTASHALSYVDLLRHAGTLNNDSKAQTSAVKDKLSALRAISTPRVKSVLLVESSKLLPMLCKERFSALPIRLVCASSGSSALSQLQRKPFDLLICSRELPDITAIDLLSLVREMAGPNQAIPIIAISGNTAQFPAGLDVPLVLLRDPALIDNLLAQLRKTLDLS